MWRISDRRPARGSIPSATSPLDESQRRGPSAWSPPPPEPGPQPAPAAWARAQPRFAEPRAPGSVQRFDGPLRPRWLRPAQGLLLRASDSRLRPRFPSACDLPLTASGPAPRLLAAAALPPAAGPPLSPSGTGPDLASWIAPALPAARRAWPAVRCQPYGPGARTR